MKSNTIKLILAVLAVFLITNISFSEEVKRPSYQEIDVARKELANADIEQLILALTSDDLAKRVVSAIILKEVGTDVLPRLIEEMNKEIYLSDNKNIEKLNDSKWQKRIWIARLIEDITQLEFACRTSVHGEYPNYSFNKINEWWQKLLAEGKEFKKLKQSL